MGILHLNWRKEALYLTLIAAEMCWFTPWSLLIIQQPEALAPYSTAITLSILVLAVSYFSRILDGLRLDLLYQRVILIVAVVITTPLIIHSLLYPSYGWFDWGWWERAGRSLLSFHMLPPEVGISAIVLFLWWRGISIGQRSLTFQGVAFSFRLGVLLLVFSVPLWSYRALSISALHDSTMFILPFFFFSLLAVALARVEEVNQAREGVGAPFNLAWLAILLGSIAAVLVTAWLISRIYSVEGFAQIFRWLRPVLNPLLKVVECVLTLLFKLLSPFLQWFFEVLQRIFEGLAQNIEGLRSAEAPSLEEFQSAEPTRPSRLLVNALRYICLGLTGAGILAALAFGLRRQLNKKRRGEEIRESLWASEVLTEGVMSSLRGGWDRLKDMAGLVGRFGPGLRFYAAVTTRKIYANMARLAERQGFPRQPSQTPYEYLPALGLAFPDCQVEAAAITEAYVNVHYGEVPESLRDLQRIREYWQRIQESET